jgi:hypothetical protein
LQVGAAAESPTATDSMIFKKRTANEENNRPECECGDSAPLTSPTPPAPTGKNSAPVPVPVPVQLARMTCTVAMTPRAWASAEVQRARRDGFYQGQCFNHCPHEAGTSSGTLRARAKRGYTPPTLTDDQLILL